VGSWESAPEGPENPEPIEGADCLSGGIIGADGRTGAYALDGVPAALE